MGARMEKNVFLNFYIWLLNVKNWVTSLHLVYVCSSKGLY